MSNTHHPITKPNARTGEDIDKRELIIISDKTWLVLYLSEISTLDKISKYLTENIFSVKLLIELNSQTVRRVGMCL